jgi:predicted DNA binding CopG/RHH family protein
MLQMFKGLFLHERGLDLFGRNADNVRAVRGVDCRELWQQIKELAEDMSEQWSRETKLGEAARYITRNYDKLTTYLDDPRLSLTNNFSERMLRLEKLIENSSLFRTSLEGRFALDIMRSVLQTAVAAGAPLQTYLLTVLRASPAEVAANPERFTPLAWADANSGDEDS